jgi:peptidoglycan/LPS O-acetylase OafA/YrhL
MNDGTAAVVIVALSLAVGIFVGTGSAPEGYGWATFFLCVGTFTLIYSLIKMAARRG